MVEICVKLFALDLKIGFDHGKIKLETVTTNSLRLLGPFLLRRSECLPLSTGAGDNPGGRARTKFLLCVS